MPFFQTLQPKVLIAVAILVPLLVLLSPLAMSPLAALAALAILPSLSRGHLARLRQLPLLPLLGLSLLWAAISISWTPNPSFAITSLLRTAGVVVAGLPLFLAFDGMAETNQGRVRKALINSLMISALPVTAACLYCRLAGLFAWPQSDLLAALPVHFDRPTTVQVLLLLPCLAFLLKSGEKRRALILGLLVSAGVLLGSSLAAKVALLTGLLIIAGGALLSRRLMIGLTTVGILAMLVGGPAAISYFPTAEQGMNWQWMPLSTVHRLVIWRFVDQKIDEKPLQGWGYESARELGQKQTVSLTGPANRHLFGEVLPLHPHNFSLQIRLELGVAGVVLFAGMILALMIGFYHRRQVTEAAMTAAAFLVCMVAYGFWQSWWLCSLWLVAALCRPLIGRSEDL